VNTDIDELRRAHATSARSQRARVEQLASRWREFIRLSRSHAFDVVGNCATRNRDPAWRCASDAPARKNRQRTPLLECQLRGKRETERSTCEPLLVGGEVIGSVLVQHVGPLAHDERSRIKNSVVQAAPVLANLRNLAIAELRASTDALTGLPNDRARRDPDPQRRPRALHGKGARPESS